MKHETFAYVGFGLSIILAVMVFYYLWTGASFGLSLEGLQAYVETGLLRDALDDAQVIPDEFKNIRATKGCCNWLQRPETGGRPGGKMCINVNPGEDFCVEDSLTKSAIKSGYKVVDVDSNHCSSTNNDNCMNMNLLRRG